MAKTIYKKFSREDQKIMATWAVDCAERVLPLFEEAFPGDERPRKALEVGRAWVETGIFHMAEIRGASLGAHAAARDAKDHEAACFAARAAGQAVATAHVPQHAYGGVLYALKAVAAMDPANAERNTAEEWRWQSEHLPEELRQEMMKRIILQKKGDRILVKIVKDDGF